MNLGHVIFIWVGFPKWLPWSSGITGSAQRSDWQRHQEGPFLSEAATTWRDNKSTGRLGCNLNSNSSSHTKVTLQNKPNWVIIIKNLDFFFNNPQYSYTLFPTQCTKSSTRKVRGLLCNAIGKQPRNSQISVFESHYIFMKTKAEALFQYVVLVNWTNSLLSCENKARPSDYIYKHNTQT